MTGTATPAATASRQEIWPLTTAHRFAVLEVLSDLSEEQWGTPSLCTGWSVRDVAAHQVETFLMTPPRFAGKFIAAGFRFNAMTGQGVAAHRDEPITRLLAHYREAAGRTTAPPGPALTPLVETVIHGEDMARPLGRHIDTDPAALKLVADFTCATSPLLHGKERSAGLRLHATDVEWQHGDGPRVEGPITSIILAITGRSAAITDLTGDGVDTLRVRVQPEQPK